ncbi:acyl carrier protein [Methylogaea oryzae]|nr:acyl carrier protein [Methylogaea oryzae]
MRGWDSLKNMEFRMLVEDELGRALDGLKVDQARTVGDLVALVADMFEG